MGPSAPNCTSSHTVTDLHYFLSFYNIVNFRYDEKMQVTQTAKQLKLQDDSVFATSVPLSDNTACAAFTSTPEHAHQKPNITLVSSRLCLSPIAY